MAIKPPKNAFLEDIYMDNEWAISYKEADNSSIENSFSGFGILTTVLLSIREKEAFSNPVSEISPKNDLFAILEASEERPPKNSLKKTKQKKQILKHII